VLVISMRLVSLLCALTVAIRAPSADERQPRMGIFTKPNARVELDRTFTDSSGVTRPLRELSIAGRPFILVPVFYRCPRLCGMTISGVVELVNQVPLTLGSEYSVIMYSFNPEDTIQDASDKRDKMVARIKKEPEALSALRFLTAKRDVIAAINEEIGFRVRYADKELEHSSAIFIVAPDGSVVRYFAGVEFNPSKVAQALVDATPKAGR